jgi:LysM domain
VADDPGSTAAPRPRRFRQPADEASSDSTPVGPIDIPDDTPLPTFVHATPGGGSIPNPEADGPWIGERANPAPAAATTTHAVDQGWLAMLDDRSADPDICPFLRAVDDGDRLVPPVEAPDPANRCAALRDPVPQSLRQQELVCLASGHINCPRYLRGAVVVAEAPDPVVAAGRAVSPAVLVSLVILVMAASTSVAFVLARGGMEMAVAAGSAPPAPSVTAVAAAPASPTPTIPATAAPTASPTASPTSSPTPTPTATPTPTPAPTPSPTARPSPTSDRYALLRACPGTPRCWIYRVRAGDNLFSIANYFGVSLDSIYDRNPWARTQGLRAGQELRLPPPTR